MKAKVLHRTSIKKFDNPEDFIELYIKKRKEFDELEVGNIIEIKNLKISECNRSLYINKGKIICKSSRNIVIEDIEKSYKRHTITLNSFIIGSFKITEGGLINEKDI